MIALGHYLYCLCGGSIADGEPARHFFALDFSSSLLNSSLTNSETERYPISGCSSRNCSIFSNNGLGILADEYPDMRATSMSSAKKSFVAYMSQFLNKGIRMWHICDTEVAA